MQIQGGLFIIGGDSCISQARHDFQPMWARIIKTDVSNRKALDWFW